MNNHIQIERVREALQMIVRYMEELAGTEDTASLQIGNDGQCILRVGSAYADMFDIQKCAEELVKGSQMMRESQRPIV